MPIGENLEQFQILENKIESLIQIINSLKTEKTQLLTRLNNQEEKIDELTKEIEQLREAGETAKQKTMSLLQKIEQIEVST
jgi:uncharacterized protein (UPF0305 family)